MWTMIGMAIVLLGAVRSLSYAVWLWDQNQRWSSFGVLLLTGLSLAIPLLAIIKTNL